MNDWNFYSIWKTEVCVPHKARGKNLLQNNTTHIFICQTHTSQEKNWRFNLFKDLKSSNNQDLLFIYSTLSVTYSTGHLSTCQTVQKLMSMIQKEYNVLQTTLRFICLKIINICSLLHNDSYYSRFSIDKMDASPSQFFDTAMRHNSKTHWH